MISKIPDLSILDARNRIKTHKPQYAAKFDATLRRVIPLLAERAGKTLPEVSDDSTLWRLAADFPAKTLLDCVVERSWAPWVVDANDEFKLSRSVQSDYRKAFLLCLKHLSDSGLLLNWTLGMSEAMLQVRSILRQQFPLDRKAAEAMLACGQTECFGIPFPKLEPRAITTRFKAIDRSAGAMFRHMSNLGIERLEDIRPEHIYGNENSWWAANRRWYSPDCTYSLSKKAWNIIKQIFPDMPLADWPEPLKNRNYGLLPADRPFLLLNLIRDIKANMENDLEKRTQDELEQFICRYAGYLRNILGYDIMTFCESLDCTQDLASLMFGPFPPIRQGHPPLALDELHRIIEDPDYRSSILLTAPPAMMRHEAQGTCRENPLLAAHVNWLIKRGYPGAAGLAVRYSRIVAAHFLKAHPSQFGWSTQLWNKTQSAKAQLPPSKRLKRKRLLEKYPDLWLSLVEARPRMRTYSHDLRHEYDAATVDKSKHYWGTRWAASVRDEVMIGFLLGFFLRGENIATMRIGQDIDIERYLISLMPDRTKPDSMLLRQFHQAGPFSDMMALFDEYIQEARPILLGDRPESPYLFLSSPRTDNSVDEDGHAVLWHQQLANAVDRACKTHFRDIIPADVGILSPHDFRDLRGNYTANLQGGSVLGAQGLGNTQAVAFRYYQHSDRTNARKVHEHLEGLDVKANRKKLGGKAARRKAFKDGIPQVLSADLAPREVNGLLRLFDECSD